jgi:hypothetical protein
MTPVRSHIFHTVQETLRRAPHVQRDALQLLLPSKQQPSDEDVANFISVMFDR